MLAQGQSSSAKRGGLAAVSSGLVFPPPKKKELIMFNKEFIKWDPHQHDSIRTNACFRLLVHEFKLGDIPSSLST